MKKFINDIFDFQLYFSNALLIIFNLSMNSFINNSLSIIFFRDSPINISLILLLIIKEK